MKIHTLTIIIFFFISSISFAQRNKTDLQKMNLKGKIVWIEEMEYNSTGKKRIISREETSQVTIQKFEFNTKGSIIEENLNSENGIYVVETSNIYDSIGRLIKSSYYSSYFPNGYWLYMYDNNGNEIETLHYESSSIDNNETELEYNLEKKIVKLLDSLENKVFETIYDGNGQIKSKRLSSYDTNGNLIEIFVYNNVDSLLQKRILTYDKKGNNIKIQNIGSANYSREGRVDIQYNKLNDIIKQSFYDKNNVLIEHHEYKYKYDSQKNWIKRVEVLADKSKSVSERKILYR